MNGEFNHFKLNCCLVKKQINSINDFNVIIKFRSVRDFCRFLIHKMARQNNGADDVAVNIKETEYLYEDSLDIIGFGKVQIIALLVCGLILLAVINETMGMMIIIMASSCDLNLGSQEKGLLTAVSFIGIMISSHLWGYLADTTGRKPIIIYTLFSTCIFTTISAFINNYWLFVFIRLLAGISISGSSATLYAYLGELNVVRYRATTISWASLFVGIAYVYIPGLAWLILPQQWSIHINDDVHFRPWRLLLILYTLPGLISALCLLKLPESPKFLLSQGKTDEALEIVQWIYKLNTGRPIDEFQVTKLRSERSETDIIRNPQMKKDNFAVIKSMWNQTIPLFRRPYLVNFTICCILQFGVFFTSAGMGLWFPEIQNRISASTSEEYLTVCSILSSSQLANNLTESSLSVCNDEVNTETYISSLLLGIFNIGGYIILSLTINPFGREIVLPAALILSGVAGLALNWITESIAIVVFFCLFLMFAGICISVVNGAAVDIIPTNLRGMAVCISLMIGRLGSVVGSNLVGFFLEYDCTGTFALFSGFIICCGLLAMRLPSSKSLNKTVLK